MEKEVFEIKTRTLKNIISRYMQIVTLLLAVLFLAVIFYFQVVNERRQVYLSAVETFFQIEQVLGENKEELADLKQVYRNTCLHNAEAIAYLIEDSPSVLESVEELKKISTMIEVDEIHIFDTSGRIFSGTHPSYYGYTFDSGEQMRFFKPMLEDKSLRLIQEITPNTAEMKMMQYSALWSRDGEFIVQVGMEPVNVLKVTEKNELSYIFSLLRVNSDANYYAIHKENGTIVGSTDLSCVEQNSAEIGLNLQTIASDHNGFYTNVNDVKSYCVFMESGENYIGRVISCSDMYRRVPSTMAWIVFCLIAVAVILYYVVTCYMNRYVVQGIQKINEKLNMISQGNLDEIVDIQTSAELAELCRYINQMKKSILDNRRKITYIIGKTKMPIGVYEYNHYMKRVSISEHVPEILALNAGEYERLSADYRVFQEFIIDLRRNIVDDESCVYSCRERYVKLEEVEHSGDVFGVIIDVTQEILKRKKIEDEREAKSRFLSNMSHEIRTPINAVLGMNEMILREASDAQILTYAANIKSSGKMLLFLINDILDISKIESGKMEIIPVEYETPALIMDLWNVIYLRTKEKKLTFTVESDETLPLVLYGDDVRIRQIVTNLLTNAVKYTPQGSVHLKAAYECQSDDRMLLKISVQDTGIGIRKEDMGKLFESFQRLDEEQNRNIEGTGLGMNITMSLLKMMDGELKVESEYQKGSTFTVIIPQKIISREPAGSFRQMKEKNIRYDGSRQSSFTAPKGKVLVVDDNTMNLTVFQALLKRTKLQVVTAESGNQCLSYVQKQKFHIIFMDHMMPKMDGIETLHEIKKLAAFEDFPNKDTPVIALTANAVAGAKEMYLAQGFAEFLTKPINAELMEYTICKYLPAELMQTAKEAGSDQETANGAYETDSDLERGVSIRNGLKYSKGDMELYLELVRMFLKDQNKIKLLRQYLSVHNMKDYAILVHALKGNARTLGADALADLAYEHEMHSKAGQEDYITAHWAQLEQAWETARETFESIYKKYAAAPEETADLEERKPLELPQEKLDETAALIDDFKTDAAVEQIKEWLRGPLRQDTKRLLTDVLAAIEEEYDDEKAIGLLKSNIKSNREDEQ
ncbi:MAG: response regulator [Eubacterium sp.]|nr:response regulator [Eubacterium sp.]